MAQFNPYQASNLPAQGTTRAGWIDWIKGLFQPASAPQIGNASRARIPVDVPGLMNLGQLKAPNTGIAYPGGVVGGLPHSIPSGVSAAGVIQNIQTQDAAAQARRAATVKTVTTDLASFHPNIPMFGH